MTDAETQKAIYDMLLVIYQEWPELKGHVMKCESVQHDHDRRLANLESFEQRTGRHEVDTLVSRNRRWTDAVWRVSFAVVTFLLAAGIGAVLRGGLFK
jgi:hypothetical protein